MPNSACQCEPCLNDDCAPEIALDITRPLASRAAVLQFLADFVIQANGALFVFARGNPSFSVARASPFHCCSREHQPRYCACCSAHVPEITTSSGDTDDRPAVCDLPVRMTFLGLTIHSHLLPVAAHENISHVAAHAVLPTFRRERRAVETDRGPAVLLVCWLRKTPWGCIIFSFPCALVCRPPGH